MKVDGFFVGFCVAGNIRIREEYPRYTRHLDLYRMHFGYAQTRLSLVQQMDAVLYSSEMPAKISRNCVDNRTSSVLENLYL